MIFECQNSVSDKLKESLQFLGCLTSLMLTITVDSRLLEIIYGSKRVKMALHSKRISNHFLRQWTIQQLWYLNIGHIDQICVLLVEYRLKLRQGRIRYFQCPTRFYFQCIFIVSAENEVTKFWRAYDPQNHIERSFIIIMIQYDLL